jgi:hypothetical protein
MEPAGALCMVWLCGRLECVAYDHAGTIFPVRQLYHISSTARPHNVAWLGQTRCDADGSEVGANARLQKKTSGRRRQSQLRWAAW